MTVKSLVANIAAVQSLLGGRLDTLLPPEHQRFAEAVSFELRQARTTLETVEQGWITQVISESGYATLRYLKVPLSGAARVITDNYAPSLGLTLGFNALDGD